MNELMANKIFEEVVSSGKVLATAVQEIKNITTIIDDHHDLIVETRDDVKTIVSKQNADMLRFVSEREAIYDRLKPLENDLKIRQDTVKDVKKKVWDIVWDWVKLGVVFLAGYLLTLIKHIK